MAAAPVGDDVYGDDPTVRELEARASEILGKEAGVFMPTGSMSNQVAVRAQTEPGDLVLTDGAAHLVLNEGGAAAAIGGVTMRHLAGTNGVFTADAVHEAVTLPHPFNPDTLQPPPRLLCVENTHNAGGGTVWPLAVVREVCEAGREHGLALHLDGARLWHASAASGVPERDYAEPFDTVNVCFSKGLGAPVGSLLAGSAPLMARARRFRQQMGGGLRQAGILAAAALHGLRHHHGELAQDIRKARRLAEALATLEGVQVDLDRVQSNIVRFEVTAMTAGAFTTRCHELGVHMLPSGRRGVRAVVHRDVGADEIGRALQVVSGVLAEAGAERAPTRMGSSA